MFPKPLVKLGGSCLSLHECFNWCDGRQSVTPPALGVDDAVPACYMLGQCATLQSL